MFPDSFELAVEHRTLYKTTNKKSKFNVECDIINGHSQANKCPPWFSVVLKDKTVGLVIIVRGAAAPVDGKPATRIATPPTLT